MHSIGVQGKFAQIIIVCKTVCFIGKYSGACYGKFARERLGMDIARRDAALATPIPLP